MLLITIGAKSSNRLVLDKSRDPKYQYISGYHAELLLLQDGSIYLTDKTSMNGTKVNGKRIEPEVEVSVRRGDVISLADVYTLDWNKIPVIPSIDPTMWDIYSIGTDYRNRIKINDSTNSVSRFHATLKVNKKSGKIVITDYSSNGTFVNGNRITSEQEVSVEWKQRVSFANTPFDWSRVKKPAQTHHILLKMAVVVAVGLVLGLGFWQWDSISGVFNCKNVRNTEQAQKATVLTYHRYFYDVTLLQGIREYGNELQIGVHPKALNVLDMQIPCLVEFGGIPYGATGTAFFVGPDGKMVTNKHIAAPWEFLSEDDRAVLQIYSFLLFDLTSDQDYVSDHDEIIAIIANSISEGTVEELYKSFATDNIKSISGETQTLRVGFYDNYYESLDKFEPCKVISTSQDNDIDLAIIQLNEKKTPLDIERYFDVNRSIKADERLRVDDKIKTLGYPTGLAYNYRAEEGGLKPIWKSGGVQRDPSDVSFDMNIEVIGGASGSPVVNEKMELVGVVNSRLKGGSTFGKAILSKHIKDLLDKTN